MIGRVFDGSHDFKYGGDFPASLVVTDEDAQHNSDSDLEAELLPEAENAVEVVPKQLWGLADFGCDEGDDDALQDVTEGKKAVDDNLVAIGGSHGDRIINPRFDRLLEPVLIPC